MSIELRPRTTILMACWWILAAAGAAIPVEADSAKPAARSPALPPAEEGAGLPPSGAVAKRAVASSRLLVPYFLVDATNPDGVSTFFSVRNESLQDVEIAVTYYATDRPSAALRTDQITLAKKKLRSFNVRQVLPDLLVDGDGFARGYVIIENLGGDPVIQGETMQLNPDEGFASAIRLPDIDPESPHYDLCAYLSLRFLNGGPFDGGTLFTVWLDLDEPPAEDAAVFEYSVYRESGGDPVFSNSFFATEVAFQVKASDLVSVMPVSFGVIEFEIPAGSAAHISGTLSASGLYSVGFEAVCVD